MQSEHMQRVYELFHEIGALPDPERHDALRQRCGDDEELYKEVQALLTTGVTQETVTVRPDATDTTQLKSGDVVGPYKILEQIGEGGFAIVYLAEQQQPVRRKVALKIIKLGMDTKQVIARFEAERQALAMMEHPNVAKVFDAGATETGRPYFVMEHVAGTPITDYCDRHRLDITQRLNLFMQVCEGVQHAHQKGIIHRDIKPPNVLVSINEDVPHVKVIDFGVAKAISHSLTEKTIYTEQGQLIGTPEYMSPEQAEMTAEHIDTRTDIYSLGVLLYELLTGALPFESTTLRQAAFAELQRIIREEEPSKPSTRLSSAGAEMSTSAKLRRADTKSLLRQLRGDLDWIVMKAMDKERERRFRSPADLSDDIARFLNQQPIEARPASTIYRVRRFVKRNRFRVGATSTILAMLLIGIIVNTVSFTRGSNWRDAALSLSPFHENWIRVAVGHEEDLFNKLALDQETWGDDHAVTLETKLRLAYLLDDSDRSFEAERLFKEVLESARRMNGQEHPSTAGAMYRLADFYCFRGRVSEAEPLILKSYEIRKNVLGEGHSESEQSRRLLMMLAAECLDQDKLDEAYRIARMALEFYRRAANQHDADPSVIYTYAGMLLYQRPIELRDPQAALTLALRANKMTDYKEPDYLYRLARAYEGMGAMTKATKTITRAIAQLDENNTMWDRARARNEAADAAKTVQRANRDETDDSLNRTFRKAWEYELATWKARRND